MARTLANDLRRESERELGSIRGATNAGGIVKLWFDTDLGAIPSNYLARPTECIFDTLAVWLPCDPEFKITGSVIEPVTVSVVDVLALHQGAPKSALHGKPVFKNPECPTDAIRMADQPIAVLGDEFVDWRLGVTAVAGTTTADPFRIAPTASGPLMTIDAETTDAEGRPIAPFTAAWAGRVAAENSDVMT